MSMRNSTCILLPWGRHASLISLVLPRLCVGKIALSFILSVCLSVCLLPWHSSLSAHYFHGAFSRATKLARPLAKVVSYCSVVFWKKRTEQKATNIPKHEKEPQRSVRYFQQRLKLIFTKNTRFRIKNMCEFC